MDVIDSEVEILTAVAIADTWSILGQTIAAESMGVKILAVQRSAFGLIEGSQ
jgi:hypothetical protein